jgi:hypothetical protein
MSDAKNQHYVPRCYLRSFTFNNKLVVYNKDIKTILKDQNVEKFAVEEWFYDFSDDEIADYQRYLPNFEKQFLEKLFSDKIEPELSAIINKLPQNIPNNVDNFNVCISKNDKKEIAYQIIFQIFRTRKYRDFLGSYYQLDDKFTRKLHIESLLDIDNIQIFNNILMKAVWSIYINKSNIKYITSDNPIILLDINTGETYFENHHSSNNIELFYPLTPNILINIHLNHFFKFMENSSKDFFEEIDVNHVDYANSLQIRNASRFVFSSEHFEIDSAKNFLDRSLKSLTFADINDFRRIAILTGKLTMMQNGKNINVDELQKIQSEIQNIISKRNGT